MNEHEAKKIFRMACKKLSLVREKHAYKYRQVRKSFKAPFAY